LTGCVFLNNSGYLERLNGALADEGIDVAKLSYLGQANKHIDTILDGRNPITDGIPGLARTNQSSRGAGQSLPLLVRRGPFSYAALSCTGVDTSRAHQTIFELDSSPLTFYVSGTCLDDQQDNPILMPDREITVLRGEKMTIPHDEYTAFFWVCHEDLRSAIDNMLTHAGAKASFADQNPITPETWFALYEQLN
jgi:hypothetical protein